MNFLCYLQEDCRKYNSGDNKPPNHHVRMTTPCVKWLDDSCEMAVSIRLFYGEVIACNIEDVREKKGRIKG